MPFKFGKEISSRWNNYAPFYDCLIVKRIWNQLKAMLSNNLNFPISTLRVPSSDFGT